MQTYNLEDYDFDESIDNLKNLSVIILNIYDKLY